MDNKIVLAIIGASIGQKKLYEKAHEMGIYVIGFSWPEGAVCRDLADKFYPISILEKDRIVKICKEEKVQGVVSNASDLTAEIVSYVSEKLNLQGNPYQKFLLLKDKYYIRSLSEKIKELCTINYTLYKGGQYHGTYPCVVKPVKGAAKKGVSFVDNELELINAIKYAKKESSDSILIEEYIEGNEISVESISFEGKHYIIQITDKDTTGAPHFIEIGHHQPASIESSLKEKVSRIVEELLNLIGFCNGASHIEFKYNKSGDVYLIEINPRGGGGEISNQLIKLSTSYDFLKAIINISLGKFERPSIKNLAYSGIYFSCQQTKLRKLLPEQLTNQPWIIDKEIASVIFTKESSNYDRKGFFIYQWWRKIESSYEDSCLINLNKLKNRYSLACKFIEKINKESGNNFLTDKWVNKILGLADIFCIIKNDEIIAWIVIYCNNYETRIAYCAGLYVLSEWRKNGYAQNLLNAAIFICQQRHFKELTLYCNNPIAERLYEKNGFTFVRKELVPNLHNKEYNFFKLLIS